MTDTPARIFGLAKRPDLPVAVVDQMMRTLREVRPSLMRKNGKGHWCFRREEETFVEQYLLSPQAQADAEASVRAMSAYGSGKAKGLKEATVRVRVGKDVFDLDLPAAEEMFQEFIKKNEEMERQNADLQQRLDALSKPELVLIEHFMKVQEENEQLKNRLNALTKKPELVKPSEEKRLTLVLKDEEKPKRPEGTVILDGPKPATRLAAARRVGLFLATRPDLDNAKWKTIAEEATKAGLRTVNGLEWTVNNITQNKPAILAAKEECQTIWKGGKPRIRVRQYQPAAA